MRGLPPAVTVPAGPELRFLPPGGTEPTLPGRSMPRGRRPSRWRLQLFDDRVMHLGALLQFLPDQGRRFHPFFLGSREVWKHAIHGDHFGPHIHRTRHKESGGEGHGDNSHVSRRSSRGNGGTLSIQASIQLRNSSPKPTSPGLRTTRKLQRDLAQPPARRSDQRSIATTDPVASLLSQLRPDEGFWSRFAFLRASSSICQSWTGIASEVAARSSPQILNGVGVSFCWTQVKHRSRGRAHPDSPHWSGAQFLL